MVAVDWVAGFYRKQYEWADWRNRWADFDPARADPHVDGSDGSPVMDPRILELEPEPVPRRRRSPAQDTTS